MSNKRIDLTLYEGHTKGDPNDNPDSWRVVGDGFVMNGTHPQPRYIGYIRHSNFEPDIPAKREPLSEADAKLIADAPRLLAELKRCYYEIDLLREYAKCGNCGGQYIGPMDYGLHEWEHSKDCFDASE